MIKVLEVIRQGKIGGGESHLLDLIHFINKDEIEPICLSFTDGEMINRLTKMGIKCHVINTEKPFDISVQNQIINLIKEEGIELIHAHGSRAASNMIYPVRKLKLPFIYTVHGWSFHDDQSLLIKTIRSWSEKLICHFANKVICVSQSNKETGQDTFGLKKAQVIENGVNLERFNPSAQYTNLREEFGLSDSDFVIGFIARCTKQKNPIEFLESLKLAHVNNPAIKGVFIGEGEMDPEVDDYIKSNQMSDYLFRSPFRTDVPEILSAIDVYCLPSLWEGLSIALLEAMAMEKAIIATPTDGTCELIHNEENGLIIPFNDAHALADAMTILANSPEKCKQYGISARSLVAKRFNAKHVADEVTQIYHNFTR
jgi:glycosyltransferase involved in cell wall biosynthesis